MSIDDIIRMAREAGFEKVVAINPDGSRTVTVAPVPELERFAALVAAAERNKVAKWMIDRSYATGHGDTVEDLLKELEWQVREAVCRIVTGLCLSDNNAEEINRAIRARGRA